MIDKTLYSIKEVLGGYELINLCQQYTARSLHYVIISANNGNKFSAENY